MAVEQSGNQPVANRNTTDRAITAAKRRQLQAYFDRGNAILAQDQHQPDRDYAHTMFAECVAQDPGNLQYVSAMLDNLHRKHDHNKRGSRFARFARRGPLKRAVAAEDWDRVLPLGIDLLKVNPWDVATLRAMANACQAKQFNEAELLYLKNALDVNAKDVNVCRHCAETLARLGQFDQAIELWHRIEELDKRNAEAREKISELTLGKRQDLPAGLQAVIDQFEQQIQQDDAEPQTFIELSQIYTQANRLLDAYQVLCRGIESTGGGNLPLIEMAEDAQIRLVRHQVAIADARAERQGDREAADLARRFRAELNRQEIQVLSFRSERHPDDLTVQYELGIRLKRDGNYGAAKQAFSAAAEQPALAAVARLETGECLQHLKRYRAALQSYQNAVAEAKTGSDTQKQALFRLGVLAAALKNVELAQRSFQQLLQLDPDYRDVRTRLDKIEQIRDSD